MGIELTIFADSVDDIRPVGNDSLEVTLEGVDLSQLINEIGVQEILDDIPREEIDEWIKEKDEEDQDED